MTRYFLTLEYDGGGFVGWQRQAAGVSVQAVIEEGIRACTGETVTVQAAGRTDAGVHALAMVAHVDVAHPDAAHRLLDALNVHLRPHPVAVLEVRRVAADLHARFSALRRHYRYRLVNRRAPLVLGAGRAWQVARPLDAERMHEAAQVLVGRHDFTSFRAAECQAASPIKTLDRLVVRRVGEEIWLEATARSFLHHQVRNLVGTLALVGRGDWPVGRVAEALQARDRSSAGPTAPPHGLYLTGVDYPGFRAWRGDAPKD